MCLDHGLQNVLDGENFAIANISSCLVRSAHPVGDREDSSKVVTWVTPLCGEPAVVKVEPSDHGADVEGTQHRVDLVWCSRNTGSIRDLGAFYDRTEQLRAVGELESLQTTAKGVKENEAGSI